MVSAWTRAGKLVPWYLYALQNHRWVLLCWNDLSGLSVTSFEGLVFFAGVRAVRPIRSVDLDISVRQV
jgi:hypothetical protein